MPDENFWNFSVRTYRSSGIAEACLSLQNNYGADVNMVLYCIWFGAAVGLFDDETFERASDFSTRWAGNVVKPLREARTWMKQSGCELEAVPTEACMALREKIKTVEFAAEKMQQEVLESMVSFPDRGERNLHEVLPNVVSNLYRYANYADIEFPDDVKQKLSSIVEAAFPDWSKSYIRPAFD